MITPEKNTAIKVIESTCSVRSVRRIGLTRPARGQSAKNTMRVATIIAKPIDREISSIWRRSCELLARLAKCRYAPKRVNARLRALSGSCQRAGPR